MTTNLTFLLSRLAGLMGSEAQGLVVAVAEEVSEVALVLVLHSAHPQVRTTLQLGLGLGDMMNRQPLHP